MKAYVQNGYGTADVYELVEVPRPVPSQDEVLVKVVASAVNDWECGVLRPAWIMRPLIGARRPRGKFRIMGCDMAGRVESAGQNVSSFASGDEVYGDLSGYGFGGFAEYVCVNPENLERKPAGVSFEQAAAIPHAAELALQAMRSADPLRAGQEVLVNGAGGGVGTLLIQLLKRLDVEVTGVDRASKLGRLRELGYDHVVAWPEEDFTRLGRRYDLIVDVKTSAPAYAYLRALKPAGVYATVGGDKIFSFMSLAPVVSLFTRRRLKAVMLKPNRNLSEISALLGSGALAPIVDEVFAFCDLRQALTRFQNAQHVGKIVIRMP
ncbi:MAG: NAD(P)-dependent alcohol dehydrogenase [Gammaproteobacteria bacterium]|jgi:NADPH:quinone reductase-like Zn-dependent oxidoreductase